MNYKIILGAVASALALVSYLPYLRDIFKGTTKPHTFSWLVWTILTAIGFAAQVSDNAGPGAWATGITLVIALIIFIFSLKYGKRNIVFIDWVLLAGAGLSIFLWYITSGPLLSVILITLTDMLAFIPTIRKSFVHPWEETLSSYALNLIKHPLSVLALTHISIITALYPVYLIFANIIFVTILIVRRKQLAN